MITLLQVDSQCETNSFISLILNRGLNRGIALLSLHVNTTPQFGLKVTLSNGFHLIHKMFASEKAINNFYPPCSTKTYLVFSGSKTITGKTTYKAMKHQTAQIVFRPTDYILTAFPQGVLNEW